MKRHLLLVLLRVSWSSVICASERLGAIDRLVDLIFRAEGLGIQRRTGVPPICSDGIVYDAMPQSMI